MSAADAIKNFIRDIREIDRRSTKLRQDRAEKVRGLHKAQAQQAMSCAAVRGEPAMTYR